MFHEALDKLYRKAEKDTKYDSSATLDPLEQQLDEIGKQLSDLPLSDAIYRFLLI